MRQQIVACVLVVAVFVPSIAFAQERRPLATAIRNAARQAAAQPAAKPQHSNRYFWPGIVMIGAGSTLAALAATAAKKETCGVVSIGFDVIGGCVEETNKPLLWIGVAAAAGGATLMAIGASRHQVSIAPGAVRYRVRF